MTEKISELRVDAGPLKGTRYTVPPEGLRLGRSSSCEISVKDPALSRNHCLFEVREGAIWVTDLASANGTLLNGAALGADSKALRPGDVVTAGDTVLTVVGEGSDAAPVAEGTDPVGAPRIDLGFGPESSGEAPADHPAPSPRRFLLWALAALATVGSVVVFLLPEESAAPSVRVPVSEKPRLLSLAYEKVEATTSGIYRYALSLDKAGLMSVEIDDVPKENRHVRKSAQLSSNAVETLSEIFSDGALYKLDPEYTGVSARPDVLKSCSLRVVRGGRVFTIAVENTVEPDALRAVREKLETFSKNELGIWAIQFSAEKLTAMSTEAARAADAKWEERDVQFGNLAAALKLYSEAVFYLETVNPKPAGYDRLVARRLEASSELDRRYRDQRFLADRAINLGDWETARRELRVLCDLLPDEKDNRHAEASAKLLDVEARMKKGGQK